MRLILLGPPGIGKGTQAKRLATRFSIPHLSSGDILRHEIEKKSDLGILAQSYMNRGKLVPDDVTLDMMAERLTQQDAYSGYILDGFPRTVYQAEGLDRLLAGLDQQIDVVVALEGNEEVLVRRLSSRRMCSDCGKITSLISNPPQTSNTCDSCGGHLYLRDDDRPEVIRERLMVYRNQTEPLILYYSARALLKTVNGIGAIEEITENIVRKLPEQTSEA